MAKLEIIGGPQSNYVWSMRMLCEEKGVPYDNNPAWPHTPEVQAIHPLGKIPAMRHGDVTLCESKAIATYIDRAFGGPKLIPEDVVGAALVEQWVSIVNTAVVPASLHSYVAPHVFTKSPDGKPDRAAIDAAVPKMQDQMAMLDRAVAKTGHLASDGFTFADINLLPVLFYVGKFPEGEAALKSAKNLSAYVARHSARPSFKATIPPPMPARG